MIRRELLLTFGAIPLTVAWGAIKRPYGFVDVDRACSLGIHPLRVWCDGEELNECRAFDDVEGWADVLVLDDSGRAHIDQNRPDELLVTRIYGKITILPNAVRPTWTGGVTEIADTF